MFNLPHKPTSQTAPDFTQMLILCSLALFVGLTIPVRGSFVITSQIVLDTFQTGTINLLQLAVPIIAVIIIISSFAAFQYRKRFWGAVICSGSIYVFLITNMYLRERTWLQKDAPQLGAAILFASCVFLVVISLLYMFRPGKRPQRVFWWRPEPRANQLIRLSAILFTGGIICTQNNVRVIGYLLILISMIVSYSAYKL
jgi:hypothetical protein